MAALKSEVSRCGLCRFYDHEGRRGGTCSRLNSSVLAKWDACRLAVSPFESGCERKEAIALDQNRWLVPETSFERVACPTAFSSTTFSSTALSPIAVNSATHSKLTEKSQS